MAAASEKALELEGMVAALSVLRLLSPDLEATAHELEQKTLITLAFASSKA